VASVAAVAAMAAGPAGASSGIVLHANTNWASGTGASGTASIEFNMDGSGWSGSTHNVNVPAGTYKYYVYVVGHSASGGGMGNLAEVCSATLKTKGTFQCSNGHIANFSPGFTPSSFSPEIMNGQGVQVASGKF
jgi:hypothetical protein